MKRLVAVAVLSLVALAATPSNAEEAPIVVSLLEIDCQGCGAEVAEMLEREPGVRKATFVRDAAEIEIWIAPGGPDGTAILTRVGEAGFRAELGPGKGSYLPSMEFPEGADVAWISRAGEAGSIEGNLAPGKVTVVDFYAVWCGPCREVDEEMKRILADSADVALRKVNVVDWDSPIARQELAGVSALPYVEVYGKSGKRVAAITGLDLERLHKAIEKGRRK